MECVNTKNEKKSEISNNVSYERRVWMTLAELDSETA